MTLSLQWQHLLVSLTYTNLIKIDFNLAELLMFRRMISKQFHVVFVRITINLS